MISDLENIDIADEISCVDFFWRIPRGSGAKLVGPRHSRFFSEFCKSVLEIDIVKHTQGSGVHHYLEFLYSSYRLFKEFPAANGGICLSANGEICFSNFLENCLSACFHSYFSFNRIPSIDSGSFIIFCLLSCNRLAVLAFWS